MIELNGLTKHFGNGPSTVRAVDGIDLHVGDGEFIAVVGRSGSGKTTTLDCLGLLLRPTNGTVVIDGVDTGSLSEADRARFRSHKIGFVFQGFNLLPTLTALENVMLPVRYSHGDKDEARARAEHLFEEIEMVDRMHHRPAQLSGGEQQRVAIARALINQPTLVLGDEPTGEVDSETSEKLLGLMRRTSEEYGATFVIVTHDLELAARTDRIVRLRDGKVIADEVQGAAKAA